MSDALISPVSTRISAILHDGSSPTLLRHVRALLPSARTQALDASTLQCAAGDTLLVVFDWQHLPQALAVQDLALQRQARVLFLGLEPGSACFGPLVEPAAQSGCLACMQTWTYNNLRQDEHWSSSPTQAVTPGTPRLSSEPLSPAAVQVFERLLARSIDGIDDSSDTKQNLRGSTLRLQWDSLTSRRHRFIAHPDCEHCSTLPGDSATLAELCFQPRLKARAEDTRIANPRLSVSGLREHFVDHRSGLIKHVFQDISSQLMPLYAAEMPIVGASTTEVGYGRAESREKSEMVAMLEVLERFAGHSPRRTATTVRGSYAQLLGEFPGQVLDPQDFVLHEPWQQELPGYEMEPYSPELEYDWCWGYSMARRQAVLVPQQFAYYWLSNRPGRPINRFVYDSSSGCAMGACIEEAALYGLYEVLERDAYLSSWYGRFTPRQIRLGSIADERVQALIARSEAEGFEIHLFDMRLDVDLPLVWAMIVDPRQDAPVKSYCASGAHSSWEQAIFSALVEVTTSMGVYQRSMPAQRARAEAMFANSQLVQAMPDHVLLYSLPESYQRLQFLFGGEQVELAQCHSEPGERDLSAELLRKVQQTLRVAKDVIVVNQTFADMERHGLHCVKVLAPGLTPVTFGHQHRRVSLERLNAAARARALPALSAAQINPDPHNFP
ncbi:TOMM precursor leader peptide-binding protein [Paucibacter sp. APW11]|uniref:TOMM leader peptide-binding protein n=1 Tax=Roseateles aquae TaxID=3077235 RepID=A0ABU3PBD9_9BURK|nr:TOMM precursor leader peptide-binding protein [Paucibacter sp. APW11]MDT8999854.1 TOMM precursor leader peptide-binding protein [Paucibacter sp. APW11]